MDWLDHHAQCRVCQIEINSDGVLTLEKMRKLYEAVTKL